MTPKVEHLPWDLDNEPHQLKLARLTLHKTQQATAKILGVTHAAYSRWELGQATPAPDRREKLHKLIALGEKIHAAQKEG